MIDLTEAKARVERYRQSWLLEAGKVTRTVSSGERVPDGYWQAEYKARALYTSAAAFVAALEDAP